jgi:hypothetical protein
MPLHFCEIIVSVDLAHQRTVKPDEHARFAQMHSMVPFLFSAKTKDSFMQPFTQMA